MTVRAEEAERASSGRSPCNFVKKSGEPCGGDAMQGFDLCYSHREDLAEERRRVRADRGMGVPERTAAGEPQRLAEEPWQTRERDDRDRRRRENRAAWHAYFLQLADSQRRRSEEYEERAAALLEGSGS